MKRIQTFFLLWFISCAAAFAQKKNSEKEEKGKWLEVYVSPTAYLPLGNFSETHSVGAGIEVSPFNHSYNLRNHFFAFTYNGGFSFYFGRKETISNYSYKHPGYKIIYVTGGGFFRFNHKFNATLTAGPALSMYNGNTKFTVCSKLDFQYSLKSDVEIGPGIMYLKQNGTIALWAASFIVSIPL